MSACQPSAGAAPQRTEQEIEEALHALVARAYARAQGRGGWEPVRDPDWV